MIYSKLTKIAIGIAIIACVITNFVLGSSLTANDQIYDNFFRILLFLQKYSWPVILIIFIYAMYEYYIVGTEVVDHKFRGQRMIVSIAIFMAIFQCLPLIYAFIVVK